MRPTERRPSVVRWIHVGWTPMGADTGGLGAVTFRALARHARMAPGSRPETEP